MKMRVSILFAITVQAVLSAVTPFDDQVATATQQILSGAYADAADSISHAKTGVVTLGTMSRDYTAMQAAGLKNSASATTDLELNALSDASAQHAQGDARERSGPWI